MNDQFTVENLQYVMIQDSLETSRPINIQVNTPDEISSMFDSISYEKGSGTLSILKSYADGEIFHYFYSTGSCIIRMCADIIGYDTFVRGLNRYLNAQ